MQHDQSYTQFVPQEGVFAVLVIDPAASLEYLYDPVALEAGKNVICKEYVVYVPGTVDLRHPSIKFREEDVEFVVPGPLRDVPERGLYASMSVPIFPATEHPTLRAPLIPKGAFPWPNCYLSTFISTTVRTRTIIAVDPILCRLDVPNQLRHDSLMDEDVDRRDATLAGADPASSLQHTPTLPNASKAVLKFPAPEPSPDSTSDLSFDPEQDDDDMIELFRNALRPSEAPDDLITVEFTHDLTRIKELNHPLQFFLEVEQITRIAADSVARKKAAAAEAAARYDIRTAELRVELRRGRYLRALGRSLRGTVEKIRGVFARLTRRRDD